LKRELGRESEREGERGRRRERERKGEIEIEPENDLILSSITNGTPPKVKIVHNIR